jgi:hypothetical protein
MTPKQPLAAINAVLSTNPPALRSLATSRLIVTYPQLRVSASFGTTQVGVVQNLRTIPRQVIRANPPQPVLALS